VAAAVVFIYLAVVARRWLLVHPYVFIITWLPEAGKPNPIYLQQSLDWTQYDHEM
jgi:hypothetical protein